MKYTEIVKGTFVSRPNRFIAKVLVNGAEETVHVKNTGRCKELLIEGATVLLDRPNSPGRKTQYDLVAVYKEGIGLVNMDSQAPNKVVGEWIATYQPDYVKAEYTYGKSRFDFYIEDKGQKILMEVKGVTLEREKIAYFPDAPTERGVKHVKELIQAVEEGYECYLAFVIQMEGVDVVYPNETTHPEFAEAVKLAKESGVKVLCLGCGVKEEELWINRLHLEA